MNQRNLKFEHLFTDSGWQKDFHCSVSDDGLIVDFETPTDLNSCETVTGYTIPGFQNGHSHAFQYAMAGTAECLGPDHTSDNFWTWRTNMYKLATQISPDAFESVAAMLYSQMLVHGITHVVEFHYLHHDQNGKPYGNLAEMGSRIVAAANQAGIHVTLVPIFYAQGGFGKEPEPNQSRFISPTFAEYEKLLHASHDAIKSYRDADLGVGIHSLRAVDQIQFKEFAQHNFGLPIHLHIAEQRQEVIDCESHYAAPPISWLLDNAPVDSSWNLVHATHITDREIDRLAETGAQVVICPSTEGNLGDGFFPLVKFVQAGGHIAVGSDSHIRLCPMEDLRWLDYGQRLLAQSRNVICEQPGDDSGSILFQKCLRGGRRSRGQFAGRYFLPGQTLDYVTFDQDHPTLIHKPLEKILASIVYAGDSTAIRSVVRRGKTLVEGGNHKNGPEIANAFKIAMSELL